LAVFADDVAAMATAVAEAANSQGGIRRKRSAVQKDVSIADTEKTHSQIETGLVQQTVQIVARFAITI
jgi:hypothetical protein